MDKQLIVDLAVIAIYGGPVGSLVYLFITVLVHS